MIYGHGDDRYNFANIRMNFSSNINAAGINEGLQAHLKSCIAQLDNYPEPLADTLATRIEQKKGFPPGTVLVTNGAVEAFYLIAELYKNNKTLIYTPSFAEYEDACQRYGHTIEFRNNTLFAKPITQPYATVWLCNPNNPDGKTFDLNYLKKKIKQMPETLFVVDEAYVEFTNRAVSLEKDIASFHNLIMVRSLTKRFSIPGLRLGYLVCSPALILQLKSKLMPWRINSLAIEAGNYCFSDNYIDQFNRCDLLKESQRLQDKINAIDGFVVYPSDTSFFIVKGPVKASVLKRKLVEKEGLLIRDASNFRGLSENYFRISCQSPQDNNHLIEALKKWH